MSNEENPPSQRQLAELAATLAIAPGRPSSPTARAEQALRLYNATAGVRAANEQAGILVRGLMHYNVADWKLQAMHLVFACRDTTYTLPGLEALETLKARRVRDRGQKNPRKPQPDLESVGGFAAGRAGQIVAQIWRSHPVDNGDVLEALFYGKGECPKSRFAKFLELLPKAKQALSLGRAAPLTNDDVRQRRRAIQFDIETKDAVDLVEAAISQTWKPLGAGDIKAAWFVLELLRWPPTEATSFMQERTLAQFPTVVRWLTVLRQS